MNFEIHGKLVSCGDSLLMYRELAHDFPLYLCNLEKKYLDFNLFFVVECVKTQLALGGVCEAVMELVRKHRDNPAADLSPPIIKTATDLIVLILVGGKKNSFFLFSHILFAFLFIMN